MMRGRPNIRGVVKELIVEIIGKRNSPMTTSLTAHFISQQLNRKISWNTVQKYIDELVEADKLTPIKLPHSKKENKEGLTVYTLKK